MSGSYIKRPELVLEFNAHPLHTSSAASLIYWVLKKFLSLSFFLSLSATYIISNILYLFLSLSLSLSPVFSSLKMIWALQHFFCFSSQPDTPYCVAELQTFEFWAVPSELDTWQVLSGTARERLYVDLEFSKDDSLSFNLLEKCLEWPYREINMIEPLFILAQTAEQNPPRAWLAV